MNEKTKISSIGELLKGAFGIYKSDWQKMLLMALLVGLTGIVGGYLMNGTLDSNAAQFTLDQLASPTFWVGIIIVIAFSIPLSLALYKIVFLAGQGQKEEILGAIKFGFSNYFSYLYISILAALIVIGGFILVILPAIYFAVLLSMIVPMLVIEGQKGVAAIKGSWSLVKGNFWGVFGRILVMGIVTTFAISIVFGNYPILVDVFTALVAPLTIAYLYLIYVDLKKLQV